jgi:hypothetical protein
MRRGLARRMGVDCGRVAGAVGQRHQRAGGLVEGADPAATHHHLGAPVGQVEAPQVLAAFLLGREQQRLAVVFPQQRRSTSWSHSALTSVPSTAVAVPHRQLRRHRVLAALVAGGEGDAVAVGAVAGGGEVPGGVAARSRGPCRCAGRSRPAQSGRRWRLSGAGSKAKTMRRPSGETSKPSASGSDPLQFVGRAFEQVAHLARLAPSLPSSSRCRCGTRPIGHWWSQ